MGVWWRVGVWKLRIKDVVSWGLGDDWIGVYTWSVKTYWYKRWAKDIRGKGYARRYQLESLLIMKFLGCRPW